MTRTHLILAVLAFTVAGALAAAAALVPQKPAVIEIPVPAERLAECRETLAQVAQAPVRADDGLPVHFQPVDGLPTVRCVVQDPRARPFPAW